MRDTDKNKFTWFLFFIGIVEILHTLVALKGDWRVIGLMFFFSVLFEVIPIRLSNSMFFSGSSIIFSYSLLNYGIGTSLICIIGSVFAFFIFWSPSIKKINWFRLMCNIGMYYIGVLAAYHLLGLVNHLSTNLRIIICIVTLEIVITIIRALITRAVNNMSFVAIKQQFVNTQIPTIIGIILLYKVMLHSSFKNQVMEIFFAVFIIWIINRYTATLLKHFGLVKESNQRYKSLFDQNPDIVFNLDPTGKFTSINPVMEKNLGYNENEWINKRMDQLLSLSKEQNVTTIFEGIMKGQPQIFPAKIPHKDGASRDFIITCGPTLVDNNIVGIYGIAKDVTADKEAERTIQRMAYYDAVTGLPNRVQFQQKLNQLIEQEKLAGGKLGLLYMDLDQFKSVNDTLGHHSGDQLLVMVTQRILSCTKKTSFISRLGGDEFTIILPNVEDADVCIQTAEVLVQAFKDPIDLNGQEVFITTSIGISRYPEDGQDQETLVKNADASMYKAKESGGDSYHLFSSDLKEANEDKLTLQNRLRKALEKNEFYLVYQPQLDLKSGKVTGVETLIRWENPEMGNVPPAKFIPEAERSRLILPIGEWVLREACIQNVAWQAQGYPAITVSVNLSSVQFQNDALIDNVRTILLETGLAPNLLELEITEGLLLQNTARTMKMLKELKTIGVRISIDDFGVGYSSLSYLRHFPFDNLKIDRSFINQMLEGTKDELIIRAIIDLAHGLNMKVVAEGVETETQLTYLKEHHCDIIQGYLISRPLKPQALETSLWILPSVAASREETPEVE